jgi:hypothetical protein
MAYEGFLARSSKGGVQELGSMFIEPGKSYIASADKDNAQKQKLGLVTTFVIDCSKEDEARVYVTRFESASLAALVEDPDLIEVLAGLLKRTIAPSGEVVPDDPTARFPFKIGGGMQELVLRHVERPIEPLEIGDGMVAHSMN